LRINVRSPKRKSIPQGQRRKRKRKKSTKGPKIKHALILGKKKKKSKKKKHTAGPKKKKKKKKKSRMGGIFSKTTGSFTDVHNHFVGR